MEQPFRILNHVIFVIMQAFKQTAKKTFFTSLLVATIILCGLLFVSCTKEGPVGPQGSPGTANVIYSEWTQFSIGNWISVVEFNKQIEKYPIIVSAIDTNIIKHGAVLVYWKSINAVQPSPLPLILYNSVTNENQYLTYTVTVDTITIIFSNLDNQMAPGTFSLGVYYRYIIIPGGIPINGSTTAIKYTDYEAVKSFYNLPDEGSQKITLPYQ